MGNKLDKSRQAVAQFFKTANPEDEFFLVQFNDRANLIQPFTRNLEEIQNQLTFTQSKGRTALLDGVYMALHEMKKAKNPRKALLLISDGGDNSSRYTEAGNQEPGEGSGRPDLCDRNLRIRWARAAARRKRRPGPGLLTEIAEQTGGRQYQVDNLNELPDVAAKIGIELRNQYVLGYSPKNRDARRQVPQGPGQAGTAARHAALAAVLETGLLCAGSIDDLLALCRCLHCAGMRSAASPAQPTACPRRLPAAGRRPGPIFRSDTRLVVCHTTVVDKNGHLVTNLPQDAFKVYENGVPQPIKIFSREDVPVSLGLIIDNSGSMRDKRAKVEAAALALVKDSNPDDEVFVVNFNDEAFLDNPHGKLHQQHQGNGRGPDAHRFARRHRHARRHPHVDRPPEGEGAEGQEGAGGGHRRQR